ncbi:ECF subfamily RNA polymerase sigma-24 subunit [Sporocytophaga myxococcoides]|uniref:ECF subfamily RNA polymerase sigma-24 subunit n=1 Tax=Sporocytophaga myxococcoides TaxID=153721 RepID=A0A098LFS2_9BACT|nr:RNA polymerase sigma-70 factor [Sporocytophaga myxococcoides]GAL85314.1 ECF subfamily RNA polymerase sigma-24 subunit [Sporocytophaga myxococcoides]
MSESINKVGTKESFSDPESFERIFRTYYAQLCRSVYRIVQDKDASEDIVQEVFMKIWTKKDELSIHLTIKSYLFAAAYNSSFNYLKQQKKFSDTEEETWINIAGSDRADQSLHSGELDEHINQAINSLPPACRSVFILSRYEELSYKEIAETLQISVKTVENQMVKALKVLREKLAPFLKDAILALIFVLNIF